MSAFGDHHPISTVSWFATPIDYLVAHPTARKWVITPVIYMG